MALYPTNLTPFKKIINMEQCYCFDNILTLENPTSITKSGVNIITLVFNELQCALINVIVVYELSNKIFPPLLYVRFI